MEGKGTGVDRGVSVGDVGELSRTPLLGAAVEALSDKKARGITVLDLRHLEQAVCDYFVLCHASSAPHIRALADEVEQQVANSTGELPWRSSGRENAQWIVLDYFDVVVHIFEEDMRSFYNIDALWADAHITRFNEEEE